MPDEKKVEPKQSFEADGPPQFTPEQLATPPSCAPLVISEAEKKAEEEERKKREEAERKQREAQTTETKPAPEPPKTTRR